jgi:DNA-binding ferritin-like protein (Dps family)
LYNMTGLVVPFIVKDEKGNVVIDQSIVFNQGSTSRQGTIPASYMTDNPEIIKYLHSYGGNEANGGHSFKEIVEKKSEAVKAVVKQAPKVIEPEIEAKEIIQDSEEQELNPSDYPEATKVQTAASILKKLFPELTARDINTKDKVLAVAAGKNISFSNLK